MTDRFRFAGPDDVDTVVDLVESAYRGERSTAGWTSEDHLLGGQRVDRAMVAEILDAPDREVLVLESGDGVVACCELTRPDADGTAGLGMFAVSPTLQAGGLGRRVLDEAARLAGDWGARGIELTVIEQREALIDWYRRRGYEPTGERKPFPYGDERYGLPRRDDLRFVVLRLDLAPGG